MPDDEPPSAPPTNQAVSTAPMPLTSGELAPDKSNPPPTSKGRKYGCRMCKTRVDSEQALKYHYRQSHGIMYCSHFNKAFNNQLSLTRHQCEHKTWPYVCNTCGEDFPFESQYKTHRLTHSDCCRHACTYSDCDKRFKNKGDMNRHNKEHTSVWLTCPDCPNYRTKEKRNFPIDCGTAKSKNIGVNYVAKGLCTIHRSYVTCQTNCARSKLA